MTRTRSGLLRTVALVGAILTASCQTRLFVDDISEVTIAKDVRVDGVPFRVRQSYTVRVFHFAPASAAPAPDDDPHLLNGEFTEVFADHLGLPNPDKLFILNYKMESFANSNLTLKYQPDNTIKLVKLKGTPNPQGATELGSQAVSLATKFANLEKDIEAREKSRLAERAALRQQRGASFSLLQDYETKYQELKKLCARLKKSNTAETASEIRGLLAELNVMAVKLGRSAPWPNPQTTDLRVVCKMVS